MHLLIAKSPIHLITIIILIGTFQVSSPKPLSSPSAEDSIFSSQDLIFPNDISSSLDVNTPGSNVAFSGLEANQEEPSAGFFSNDDYLFAPDVLDANGNPNIDLLSLSTSDTGCQSSANTQAEIELADLSSSSSLWTRDEEITCPNSLGNPQQKPLDIPDLTNLLQVPGIWMPKSPNPTDMEFREGIRLPPPSGLPGSADDGCFFPHPMHCCCDGERAFSGRTIGELVRVMTIKDCNAGIKYSFLFIFVFFFSLFPFHRRHRNFSKLSLFSLQ